MEYRDGDLRAAELLRGTGQMTFDAKIERGLAAVAAEMNVRRLDLIRTVLGEWLGMRDKGLIPANVKRQPRDAS